MSKGRHIVYSEPTLHFQMDDVRMSYVIEIFHIILNFRII